MYALSFHQQTSTSNVDAVVDPTILCIISVKYWGNMWWQGYLLFIAI